MNFIKAVILIVKIQIYTRAKLAIHVILYFLPLLIVIKILEPYEDDMPEGMLEVIYMFLGFATLGLLIYLSVKRGKDTPH